MNKLREFGRTALFYVRVLSGYEERRIRNYRLALEKRIQQAEQQKAALRKAPEQLILSEVRRMVEEMQALNKTLEETEAAIEDMLKPLDKQAETLMNMQLEGEEKTMEAMMAASEEQALLELAEAEKLAKKRLLEANQNNPDTSAAINTLEKDNCVKCGQHHH